MTAEELDNTASPIIIEDSPVTKQCHNQGKNSQYQYTGFKQVEELIRLQWLTLNYFGEKDDAIERYNQSKSLIEKLEEEVKNLRELSPNNEKHFFNLLHKEYVQIIDTMRQKMKNLQEKLNDELKNGDRKEQQIKSLNDKFEELNRKFIEDEKELINQKYILKQEQEKNLRLESELITSEKQLYHLHNNYQYVNDLEEEQDRVHQENAVLSKDCNELELALEVCHQKIDYDEHVLKKVNEDLKNLIEEKASITKTNSNITDEVTELKDVVFNLTSECKKVNKNTQNLIDEKIKVIRKSDEIRTKLRVPDGDPKMNYFNEACSNVFEVFRSVNRLKKVINEYCKKNQHLHQKLTSYKEETKNYRNQIHKMKSIISFLKQNLLSLQKKIKNTTNRWQSETNEIILKMENRIQELNENYEEVIQENVRLKRNLRKSRDNKVMDD